jgi:hypothetical protein
MDLLHVLNKLIDNLSEDSIISADMGKDAELVALDILDILASSELPKTEWPGILRTVIERISPSAGRSLPTEVAKRQSDNLRGTRQSQSGDATPRAGLSDHRGESSFLPQGLQWPTERYEDAPERGKTNGLVLYLRRVWGPLIAAGGIVTRQKLEEVSPAAAASVDRYQRGGNRSLPKDVAILTRSDVINQLLSSDPAAVLSDARLAQTIASRLRRGKRIPAPR